MKRTPPTRWRLVKLNEGPVVTAQLTDLGAQPVEIGMPVEMVTRKIRSDGNERGILVYGYKFRPAWVRNQKTTSALSKGKALFLSIDRFIAESIISKTSDRRSK